MEEKRESSVNWAYVMRTASVSVPQLHYGRGCGQTLPALTSLCRDRVTLLMYILFECETIGHIAGLKDGGTDNVKTWGQQHSSMHLHHKFGLAPSDIVLSLYRSNTTVR